MKISEFPEQNLVLKGNGKDILDLPAWAGQDELGSDIVISCWEVMPLEKVLILFFSKMYIKTYTTRDHFAPILPEVDNPFQPFTEPMGKVVGSLIDRKVKQFLDTIVDSHPDDADQKKLLEKILHGFAISLIQDVTQYDKESNCEDT